MIIVTGGAGFIGSNIVKGLNQRGYKDILVVDDLSDGHKYQNMVDCDIADYLDKDDFLQRIDSGKGFPESVESVFHQGACSTTTEWDGRLMMQANYEFSKRLLHFSVARQIPFLYASSAAVYGIGHVFKELPEFEKPINVYGYSKFLFDQYVRRQLPTLSSQVVGLRYFNVYGPREQHKGRMASVAFHLHQQLQKEKTVRLFEGSDQFGPGEQRRDFIFIEDVVNVNLWLLDHPEVSGIFNVGTGRSQTFNDVARAVIDWHQRGHIEYIHFPEDLRKHYQSFTEADISNLRSAGYEGSFHSVESGVKRYLDWLGNR